MGWRIKKSEWKLVSHDNSPRTPEGAATAGAFSQWQSSTSAQLAPSTTSANSPLPPSRPSSLLCSHSFVRSLPPRLVIFPRLSLSVFLCLFQTVWRRFLSFHPPRSEWELKTDGEWCTLCGDNANVATQTLYTQGRVVSRAALVSHARTNRSHQLPLVSMAIANRPLSLSLFICLSFLERCSFSSTERETFVDFKWRCKTY